MPGYHVILDTDIGDDIDDAFCLALLLRCPDIDLALVTTTFGNTPARANLVHELCEAADRKVRIAPGFPRTLASRPYVDEPAHRRLTHVSKVPQEIEYNLGAYASDLGPHALEMLVREGPSCFLSIGPMTHFALTLLCQSMPRTRVDFTGFRPDHIAMCGEFQIENKIEYNIRCDPEAAHLCFSSGIPIDVIPWSIGPATKLEAGDIARLEASEDRLVKQLVNYLHQFWKHVPSKTNMYDPMTVVALLRPELFDWRRGRVSVELMDEKLYGLTRFEPDESGPHRVAFGVKAAEAKEFMMERLLNV